jgi:hypothetical protein
MEAADLSVFSPHSRYDCPLDSTAHNQVGMIVPWTVLHDVNPSCPIVTTVAPLLFFLFTYHHLVFILQGCHVVFTCQGFFPTLALKP